MLNQFSLATVFFRREDRELEAARERLPDAESGEGGGVEAVEAHGRPAV